MATNREQTTAGLMSSFSMSFRKGERHTAAREKRSPETTAGDTKSFKYRPKAKFVPVCCVCVCMCVCVRERGLEIYKYMAMYRW
jgi:hypothetical protein